MYEILSSQYTLQLNHLTLQMALSLIPHFKTCSVYTVDYNCDFFLYA